MFPSREYPAILGALLVLNWPLYVVLFKLSFRDRAQLKQAVWYSIVPEVVWLYQRRWTESTLAKGRLFGTIVICGVMIAFEYYVICEVVTRATSGP